MKYFFNFETYGRTGKIGNKEMFYLRLLKKRMKENYEIFRKPHPMATHMHKNYNDNMFNGNIIEFYDKKAFSKFKLDYSGLLNPKINNWNIHIANIKSFETDDDFVDRALSLYNEYNEAEALIYNKIEAERICDNHNCYMTTVIRTINDMRNRLGAINSSTVNNFINDETIKSIGSVTQTLDYVKNIIENTPMAIDSPKSTYYYEHPDITKIKTKYDTLYKQLYSNIQTHDIP